jgi:polyisoprenoid-binding protein YceI
MKRNIQNAGFRDRYSTVRKFCLFGSLVTLLCFGVFSTLPAQQAQSGVPVFKFSPEGSNVTFNVSASVTIAGKFDKWDAGLTFTSTDLSTGVLDIKIDAASVDTGRGVQPA